MRRKIINNTIGDPTKVEAMEIYLNITMINLISEKKTKSKEVIVNPEETAMKFQMRSGDLRQINKSY